MDVMGFGEEASPAERIRRGLEGDGFCRFAGVQQVDERRAILIETGHKATASIVFKWYLDPASGYLPIRIEIERLPERRVSDRIYVTAVRKCSNGAYFPERSVSVVRPESSAPMATRVIELVELDLEYQPTAKDFMLTIPAGTCILNPKHGAAFYHLKTDESIDLTDLPTILGRCEQEMKHRSSQPRTGSRVGFGRTDSD